MEINSRYNNISYVEISLNSNWGKFSYLEVKFSYLEWCLLVINSNQLMHYISLATLLKSVNKRNELLMWENIFILKHIILWILKACTRGFSIQSVYINHQRVHGQLHVIHINRFELTMGETLPEKRKNCLQGKKIYSIWGLVIIKHMTY